MGNQTSLESLDMMIKNLSKFQEIQDELIKSLKTQYAVAGNDWDDEKYTQLGYFLEELYRKMLGCSDDIDVCVKKLRELEEILDSYKSRNIF